MNRRGFLAGILAAGSAPALCKAGFLMPVKPIILLSPEITPKGLIIETSNPHISCMHTAIRHGNEYTFSYQWLLDGKPIPSATNKSISYTYDLAHIFPR